MDLQSMMTGIAVGLLTAGMIWRSFRFRGLRITYTEEDSHQKVLDFIEAAKGMKYFPTWYLAGGVLQTATADMPYMRDVKYKRETLYLDEESFTDEEKKHFCCPDVVPKGTVTLDWMVTENTGPIVVIVPGLTGQSDSAYVQRTAMELALARERYQPCVFNPRGRGGVQLETPFLYSCGYTHDFRRAMQHIKTTKTEKILAVGFSMGANYLAKYMGEEKSKSLVEGACCLAGPVDCPELMENLTKGVLGKYLFDPFLTKSLHRVRETVGRVFEEIPHPGVDVDELKKATTLWEFDNRVTAPTMGCRDADDYYDQSSCMRFLEHISHPTMFLHAENDPIVPARCLPYLHFKQNPNIVSLVTTSGGHSMAWPTGTTMEPWSPSVCIEFFRKTAH